VSQTSTEERVASGELDFVRHFVNTRELDPERERIGDPETLSEWLRAEGIEAPKALRQGDVERAAAFREAVRAMLLANAGLALDAGAVRELRAAADAAPLAVEIADDGSLATVPAAAGVDALIARVLAAIAAAQRTGEWERLKACTSDECLWAFYDRSRNRSRHWCSMEDCGNRAKTRAYRKRAAGSR
jgi:predicted RNA-binding Zn ribbon-like protein